MIVNCTECNSTGQLSDELAGTEVSCPRCSSTFVAKAVRQKKWYYAEDDNKMGPVEQSYFDSLVADGFIAPETLVWTKGMKTWQPMSKILVSQQKKWYYADGANKVGPLQQDQFNSLIASQTITPETLVWSKGMAEWQTLAEVRPPKPKKWYYADGDNKVGPLKQERFDSLIANRTIVPETMVWSPGMKEWQPLAQVRPTKQKKWYYAVGDNKIGPIRQDQFDSLVANATVKPETMVWCKGMDGWQPLAKALSATDSDECAKCGITLPLNLLQNHEGASLCKSCLPLTLPAGTSLKTTVPGKKLKYGNPIGRAIAKIIDLVFMLALAGMIEGLSRKLFPGAYISNTLSIVVMGTLLTNMLVGVFYITWFVGKLGATPGKMVCKLKITNSHGGKISYAHAFGRYCGEYIAALGTVGGLTMFVLWALKGLLHFEQVPTGMPVIFLAIFAVVYAPALLDSQRRTIYDHLCNTRVVAA